MGKTRNIAFILLAAALFPSYGTPAAAAGNNGISESGSELAGVWEDPETHNLITIKMTDGKPAVVSIIDNDDSEKLIVQRSSFENGILSFSYKVPSTGYIVDIVSTSLNAQGLNYLWDNSHAKGKDMLVRMMNGIAEEKAITPEPIKGKLVGKVYKIKNDEILIATSDASFVPAAGEKVFIIFENRKVFLNVVFPMMTVSKCRLTAQDRQLTGKIRLNTPVYR
jgi:hypothetical protein